MHEIEATISGQVHAVGFRAYVEDEASQLGLHGFVENRPDGTVRVVAQGARDALSMLIRKLHEGSSLADVESVSVGWRDAAELYDAFVIRYSYHE